MEYNVLITGGSGYLGGTLLNRLKTANLDPYKLFALVRKQAQAESVKQYGAEALMFDVSDEDSVRENIIQHKINVVFSLVDAVGGPSQTNFIRALAQLKETTGCDVHFLHTSGAKMFSSHTGAPKMPLKDNDHDLYNIQKSQRSPYAVFQKALDTNNTVIEECEQLGIRSYIFIPCIVYGEGEGFGNRISIQTVAVVKAAKALGRVYRLDDSESWPVSHVADTATLYVELLRRILTGNSPDFGRKGYYLASSGNVTWDEVYAGVATAMHKRGAVTDPSVFTANEDIVEKMGIALNSPKELVAPQLSGSCLFEAYHGSEIGWKPKYSAEYILKAIDAEVELILRSL